MDQDKPRGFSRSAVHRRVKQSMKQCIASVVANQHSPTVVVPMICTDDFAEISTDDFIEFPLSSDMNFDPVPCVTDAEFTDMSGTDAADHTLPSSTLFLSGDISETESINSDCDSESSDQCDLEDMWSVSNANYGVPLNNLLAEWAVSNNVSTSALRSLLNILKPFHPELPRDPRTLLQTPTTYIVRNITGPGHYYHFGISAGIEHVKCPDSGPIQLQFNFGGLPLFKSSKIELWPILCLVFGSKSKPFVVGIYCGKSKPKKLDEFLFDFILDLEKLLTDGILLCGVKRQITVHCFVCDAPARAYIKNIKLHSGYHGCERCVQEGEYVEGKVTFPSTTACLRTDDDFRQMIDDEHHHGPSPLTALGFGMVSGFVLDYMHLVCQGVVRRLITFWIKGRPLHRHQFSSRLPATLVSSISDRLTNLAAFVPREFARKPRGVGELDRRKATEIICYLLNVYCVLGFFAVITSTANHGSDVAANANSMASPVPNSAANVDPVPVTVTFTNSTPSPIPHSAADLNPVLVTATDASFTRSPIAYSGSNFDPVPVTVIHTNSTPASDSRSTDISTPANFTATNNVRSTTRPVQTPTALSSRLGTVAPACEYHPLVFSCHISSNFLVIFFCFT